MGSEDRADRRTAAPAGPAGERAVAALRDFLDRVGALDAPEDRAVVAVLAVVAGTGRAEFALSAGVVRALDSALRGYQDPRERGRCTHCDGRRLDDNFLCLDCGRPNGVFGQLLAERVARYRGDPLPLHRGPGDGAGAGTGGGAAAPAWDAAT